ncbi:protein bicaudal D homolog 2 [Paramormyrops kingsleyae]|uniref:Zgc:162200 n=1 Tax=Paramormyrops kingsleyae TaxID=1676925 RepID=A0A3B3S2X5_9TELE|nr:protein bicaudal D homolog 2-like [Paramormyrops kingsleyae]XP_023693338.1 protein bicaudal D homolog 2-like [Paramormyrops kingsleyae]XP_023693339.1 protein bicaudal D homolog 2-like [Paramormyrops kingsleyae]
MLEEGDVAGGGSDRALRAELERLSLELQEANEEKLQAARYGLAVLEESATLRSRHSQLEEEHEVLRREVQQLREALADSMSSHKRAAADGESREESLLEETANKEAAMALRMEELKAELQQSHVTLTNVHAENDRLGALSSQLKKECEHLEEEKDHLCSEMKEYKLREVRLLQDSSELEEENILLQKQVSMLRENQVEFEALKLELVQKQENQNMLRAQLEEAARLKEITERQLDEALEALKEEREQKNSLRREISNLAFQHCSVSSTLELHLDQLGDIGEQEDQDSGYNNGQGSVGPVCHGPHLAPAPGLVSDLLSELHHSESRDLKQQMLQAERENSALSSTVQDLQRQLTLSQEAFTEQQGRMEALAQSLEVLQKGVGQEAVLSVEVPQLREELREARALHEALEGRYRNEKERWRGEALELAEKIRRCIRASRLDQQRILELETEIGATRKVAMDSEGHLTVAREELLAFSEELANLYHHVCVCNNLTPNRVTLDYYREGVRQRRPQRHGPLGKTHPVDPSAGTGDSSASCPGSPTLDVFDPSNVRSLVALIRRQMRHLQATIELCQQRGTLTSPWSHVSFDMERDAGGLLEEILKLKSMLSTKREQIATLRTVLKANKQTAEVALANLKTKYEAEKSLVSETMLKLRNELKALKEDAATFSSLRVMFTSRCDQYVTQLDTMQKQLAAAEDEKKTLNSLLRMAIQQKLALTQRLEDLETPHNSLSNSGSPRRSRDKLRTLKSGRASRSPCRSPGQPPRNSPLSSPARTASAPPIGPCCTGHTRTLSRCLQSSPR